jgi:PhnB protein
MAEGQVQQQQPVEVKGGVVAYLMLDGAMKAAEFYQRAFGATIAAAYPPDDQGRTMHVHLYINGSSVMLSDPFPEQGCGLEAPQGFTMTLMVKDIDADYDRAVKAGATAVMPPTDMFWGDRYGQMKDPFGVTWAMNAPITRA